MTVMMNAQQMLGCHYGRQFSLIMEEIEDTKDVLKLKTFFID